jgi:imidazolonepropionase-like amidohydrolase
MGQKDVGTIEPGMLADVVLLNADRLEEIANTRQIAAVVANGRLFDGTALKAMLMDIEENARTWKGTPTGR